MSYAKCTAEFDGIYKQFCHVAPQSIKDYFNNNWYSIREEWVIGFMFSTGNFLNATNNKLESINGKLKQVVSKFSSLECFIEQFFVILPVLRNERSYKAIVSYQKKPVIPYLPNSPEASFSDLLTGYAANYVLHQLNLVTETTYNFSRDALNRDSFFADASDGRIQVTSSSCSCCFFRSMRLPCRHIFHVRQKLGLSLYDKNLCDERWTNSYFRSNHKLISNENVIDSPSTNSMVNVTSQSTVKRWSSQQKFSKALDVCKQIANAISLTSQESFEYKLNQLVTLNEAWRVGNKIGIEVFGNVLVNEETDTLLPPEPIEPVDASLSFNDIGSPQTSTSNDSNVINISTVSYIKNSILDFSDVDYDMNEKDIDADVRNVIDYLVEQVTNHDVDFEAQINNKVTVTKLQKIKMPPPIVRKGRPKGSEKTNVIQPQDMHRKC